MFFRESTIFVLLIYYYLLLKQHNGHSHVSLYFSQLPFASSLCQTLFSVEHVVMINSLYESFVVNSASEFISACC